MQLTLDIHIPAGRVLIPLEAVMVLTDKDEDQVLSLIETGAIAWAWDLRSKEATRREVRVWRESLLDYLHHDDGPRTPPSVKARLTDQDEAPTYQALMPHSRPELRTTELTRLWSVSSTHMHALIADQLLAEAGREEKRPASGPNSYIKVTRESVIAFLMSRRIQ